ncbi:hypothetical protein BN14_08201 [Rhizoctonia solani AG-1 IB]|uniref:DUF6535 domain-containing protein n=1 Tax=Thanatephorus cucumeris (strain AG1-IB / isolate 7/3/14) TaxID=1108050 RepID=M5C474_THACB|nr:hypothetical protein BN14_08201 [Rhizoctonia solani AG-1 IB]
MALILPNNLSGGRHMGKEKQRTADAQGDSVPGLGRQATIEKIPDEEHNAAYPQAKTDDAQQARYRVYQADDPVLEPDEYGAELTKDARVWKVYVKEADRWDAELVDGWNKSLDAALFSAVSTTFLIESSGMLKQDPNDVSAAALVVISHALVALAGNSSVDLSTLSLPDQSAAPFMPPHNAVVVNTLWYLSLATSIATSFLAMLAKDWCHSFAINRSGHPWKQAQRRQRKWMMIERWKMQELIVVLPSLIHLSLSDAGKRLIEVLFKLENNDQTVGYSLHWLIKHCETPSSVAVALQAIAGATRKIPKDPLEECKSSKKILKRLVSSPSGPKAAQEASLYARALRFLVSGTSSDLQQNESSSGEKQDVAVMIWDLKLKNENHYKLDPESPEVASVKAWCDNYLGASDPFFFSETSAFVAAISRVYETVAPHDTKRKCLPEAVYVILVFAATFPQSEEQFAACMDVLSRFSFPSLSTELVQYVTQTGNGSRNRLVERLAVRPKHWDDHVSKHFSATQLWLLLHLVGDLTTDTQKRLSQLLEDERYLEIKVKGFDQVKKDLETRILHYYQADRLDTYSARIIECIHESSGIQPEGHTSTIMNKKLKDVPQSHRGLKQLIDDRTTHPAPDPALIPLPQSIPSSRAPSVMAEPETISHEPEERWDVDHLSIEIVPSSPAQDENRACPDN